VTAQRRLLLGVVLAAVVSGLLLFALVPRPRRSPAGECPGNTGRAAVGRPYEVTIRVQGTAVVSNVDFDGRVWRAAGDRVGTNGLATPGATSLTGAVTLVNREQATFSSPAAFATLLPLTKADGCTAEPVVRSGSALGGR
jgi:hypothetical protein